MSSGYGRTTGGTGPPLPSSSNNRKRNKKYGLNLYQLNAPAAPPVPSIVTGAPARSSPNNGLLLLSKKNVGENRGLLSPLGGAKEVAGSGKQTENDALFASAHGEGQGEKEEGGGNAAVTAKIAPAWGNLGEKQPVKQEPTVDLSLEELSLKPAPVAAVTAPPKEEEATELRYDEKTSLLVLAPRGSLSKQKSTVSSVSESAPIPESNETEQTNTLAKEEDPPQKQDQQQQYMSKLAKERASRRKSEEETRLSQQKERAAKRLKDLESKRLEKRERDRQQKPKKKQQRYDGPPTSIIIGMEVSTKKPPVANVPKIYSRKEVSQPSIVLEPLGKKKVTSNVSALDKPEPSEKNEPKKKLYDPNRPFSSLVGGKPKEASGSVKSLKSEESSAAKDSKSSRGKAPVVKLKEESTPSSVRMVNLNSFEDRERGGGRGAPGGAQRMLFDPTSGSLVAAQQPTQQHSSAVTPKGAKKTHKPPQQPYPKPSPAAKAPDNKPFGRDATKQKPIIQKKPDVKTTARTPPPKQAKLPRTRGVLYKKDDNGNYINADECEPDCGYGQHSVPGGRIKNPTAYAKLSESNETKMPKKSNKLNADAPSFFGFQLSKDPTFLRQQTDFEAQQQRILEDAWASLEEAEPSRDEGQVDETAAAADSQVDPQPVSKKNAPSQEDEYTAALAISPTMIGLGGDKEEPFDLSFALEGDTAALPTNRFSSLGGGESRLLGSSAWGTGASGTKSGATLGEIAGLSGWTFDPNATDFTPASAAAAATGNTNTGDAENSTTNNTFINLNGWGSSGFNSFGFGGDYKNHTQGSG